MRVVVVGAGLGGLAAAVRLAAQGHRVTVCEQGAAPGGKAGRVRRDGFVWDSGPSLLTMPWVFRALLEETGGWPEDLELLRVEPVTRYRWADGSQLDLSADLPVALEALEAWSPGTSADWVRFLGTCASMWRASVPFLEGHPPWPPRRDVQADPRDGLRVRPWQTLRGLARAHTADPRLQLVIERFATYAGADPRRAPAALAVAGYVEHAFGAWHPRGGVYALVEALVRRLQERGGELRLSTPVERVLETASGVRGVRLAGGEELQADLVVCDVDEAAVERDLLGAGDPAPKGRLRRRLPGPLGAPERSLSGFSMMLGLRGRTEDHPHHLIRFPADYDAEFDDVFTHRRPVRDPTLYVSTSSVTDDQEGPADGESWFVLANAPAGIAWPAGEAEAYADRLVARLGVGDRVAVRVLRTPDDLEAETGAVAGSIYGRAPHGRLGTMGRPTTVHPRVRGLRLVGGTVHPGGGLPLVALGAALVAKEVGPA